MAAVYGDGDGQAQPSFQTEDGATAAATADAPADAPADAAVIASNTPKIITLVPKFLTEHPVSAYLSPAARQLLTDIVDSMFKKVGQKLYEESASRYRVKSRIFVTKAGTRVRRTRLVQPCLTTSVVKRALIKTFAPYDKAVSVVRKRFGTLA
jgi:hypothetical protein